MKTNELADAVLAFLLTTHARVYRNSEPADPSFPYIVFLVDSATLTNPGSDCYVNVKIFESPRASVRTMETLADAIVGDGQRITATSPSGLDNRVVVTSNTMTHFQLEQKQYIDTNDLVTAQMIDLRFVARSYDIGGLN